MLQVAAAIPLYPITCVTYNLSKPFAVKMRCSLIQFWFVSLVAGFVGEGLGFANREYLVWYILFIVFVPYAMLPLPLKWCVIAGTTSSLCHLFVTSLSRMLDRKVVSIVLAL